MKISEVKSLLSQLDVQPKKSLGQNFLINPKTIDSIIENIKFLFTKNKQYRKIIEIGPGLGSLTNSLINLNIPLVLVELDRIFVKYWRDKNFNINVIEGDALRLNWNEFANSNKNTYAGADIDADVHKISTDNEASCILVSNLPYQISSSLVIDRCVQPYDVSAMVLMFQKEVAQRITSPPDCKNYGLLSVIAQSYWKIDFVLEAGSRDFYPSPKISSRVLCFKRQEGPKPEKLFLNFLKVAFSHRRKYLLKNLKNVLNDTNEWDNIWHDKGLSSEVRPEKLSVHDYQDIFFKWISRSK